MGQEHLTHLTLMDLEYNLLREVDINIISKFDHIKPKKYFWQSNIFKNLKQIKGFSFATGFVLWIRFCGCYLKLIITM